MISVGDRVFSPLYPVQGVVVLTLFDGKVQVLWDDGVKGDCYPMSLKKQGGKR